MRKQGLILIAILCLVGNKGRTQCNTPTTSLSPTLNMLCVENSEFATMSTTAQNTWDFVNLKSDGFVTLSLDLPETMYWGTAFDLALTVSIEYYDLNDAILLQSNPSHPMQVLTNFDMNLSYDPTSGALEQVFDLKKLEDVYKLRVTASGPLVTPLGTAPPLTTVGPYINLSAYFEEERAPVAPSFNYISLSAASSTTTGYITFAWDMFDNIQGTELEWKWIDDEEERLFLNFEDGASRVILGPNIGLYEIPNIYQEGDIIFRVRPVYACGSNYDKRCTGDWSLDDATLFSLTDIRAGTRTETDYVAISAHEGDLNWTYSLTLAEDGKHKAVVGYADGMLRGRQTVSKINSLDKIVVAESIYDHVGREAISVLPVPVENSAISYTANFTQNDVGTPYTYRDFELSINCVDPVVAPMGTGSGASQYYSSNTASTQQYKDYIPDAHKYPFAATRFENNPSGAVKEQGGLGYVHRLGGDHSSRSYYGKTNQEELNRLFGADVGFANKYSKVITVDANGQRSIAIYDMAGNVIATALEGDVPSNLLSIGAPDIIEEVSLMDPNVRRVEEDGLVAMGSLEYYIFVDGSKAQYTLSYSFQPEKYSADCGLISGLCYDCVYDLSIQIYDTECNGLVDEYQTSFGPTDYQTESYNPDCTQPAVESMTDFLVSLPEGYYKITKTLTLKQDAIEFFADQYVQDLLDDRADKLELDPDAETCIKTLGDFIEEEVEDIDWTDCFYDCETCEEALQEIVDDPLLGSGSQEYTDQLAVCNEICAGNPCDAGYQAMLMDVSPGGQYARYKSVNHNESTDAYTETLYDFVTGTSHNDGPFSLMNARNKLPTAYFTDGSSVIAHDNYSWRTPFIAYADEDGNPSLFLIDGELKGPEHFYTVQDFIDNWQPSWAYSLVYYHPEYLYYEYCQGMEVSGANAFDELFLGTESYEAAYKAFLFDPLHESGNAATPSNYLVNTLDPLSYTATYPAGDPFFDPLGAGYAYRQEMLDALNAFEARPDEEGCFSLWEYAAYMASCVNLPNPKDRDDCIDAMSFAAATSSTDVCEVGDENEMWRYFKAFYWQKKQEILSKAQNEFAFEHKAYNGCIGMEAETYVSNQLLHAPLKLLANGMGGSHKPTKRIWDLSANPINITTKVYAYRHDEEQTCFEKDDNYQRLNALAERDKRYAHNAFATLDLPTQSTIDVKGLTEELIAKNKEANETACTQQCEANATLWLEELRDLAEGKGLTWEVGQTAYDGVHAAMVTHCTDNCGIDDYFGSYGDQDDDFQTIFFDKIDDYITITLGEQLDWQAATVRAEANRLFADQFVSVLDDCGCDVLQSTQEAYEALVACDAHDGQTIEEYLYNSRGIAVGNVYDLLCECEALSSNELEIKQIAVPAALSCTTCPSCFALKDVIFAFKCTYGDMWSGNFSFLDLSNDLKATFSDFANLQLGLYLSPAQYEQALECCDIYECEIDNSSHPAYYWKQFLDAAVNSTPVMLYDDETGAETVNNISKSDPAFSVFWNNIMCSPETDPVNNLVGGDYKLVTKNWSRENDNMPSGLFGTIFSEKYTGTGSVWDYRAFFHLDFIGVRNSLKSPTRSGYLMQDIASFDGVFIYQGASRNRAIFEVTMDDGSCARVVMKLLMVDPASGGTCNAQLHNCEPGISCANMGSESFVPDGPGAEPYAWEFPINSVGNDGAIEFEFNFPAYIKTAHDWFHDINYLKDNNGGSKDFKDNLQSHFDDNNIQANVMGSECESNCNDCGASQLSICCENTINTAQLNDLFVSFTANDAANNTLTNSEEGKILNVVGTGTTGANLNDWFRPDYCTETEATYTTLDYTAGDAEFIGSIRFGDCESCAFYLQTDAVDFDYADIVSVNSLLYNEDDFSSYHGNNFVMEVTTVASYCTAGVTSTTVIIYGYSTCWELIDCASIGLVCDRGLELSVENPCVTRKLNTARANALRKYNSYMSGLREDFIASYSSQCILDMTEENFTADMGGTQQHYTLYYYDQARSLVRTVPPAGVAPLTLSPTVNQELTNHREDRTSTPVHEPVHSLATTYQFNSLGGTRAQNTPDAGDAISLYDELGRLVFSQNAKQKAAFPLTNEEHFSYTAYDDLGRVSEVGQIKVDANIYNMIQSVTQNGAAQSIISDHAATKREVTKTFYDFQTSNQDVLGKFGTGQDNLVHRVAYTAIRQDSVPDDTTYDHCTYYSYDVNGNVKTVVQDLKQLEDVGMFMNNHQGHNLKRIDYDYDLLSGNVNQVSYQKGEADQYSHRYDYDADNRLNTVYVSYDNLTWSEDARYQFYDHGSMSRLELGAEHVQGLDYAYNLQGWLKAMNGNFLDKTHDMGQDGDLSSTAFTGHDLTASDAFGFVLGYYEGLSSSESDYTPIDASGTATQFVANPGTFTSLYNGNIGYFSVNHSVTMGNYGAMNQTYRYDQLQRINIMTVDDGIDATAGVMAWNNTFGLDYKTQIQYADANGNIKILRRFGYGANLNMDLLRYTYTAGTNQLEHVQDMVGPTATYDNDFEDTGTNDYVYDEIGNLIEDLSESIAEINWNAYGKVESVVRSSGSGKADLEFTYDAGGNRITKTVKNGPTPDLWERTYYIRDAAGELLATYTSKIDENVSSGGNFVARFTLEEQYLYGSARLGMHQVKEELFFEEIAGTIGSDFWDYSGSRTGHGYGNASFTRAQQIRGKVHYEISDHLGNVRSVISDRKLPTQNGAVAEFAPDIVTAQDYYPFGMLMPGRQYANTSFTNLEQRFHFQGQEGDDEWLGKGNAYAYKYRVSDSRIGRFFSVDPLAPKYPQWSPYVFSGNQVISTTELEGLEPKEDLNQQGGYTIQSGNTFWGLEESWGIPHGSLSLANPGLDPANLQINQNINVSWYAWVSINGQGFSKHTVFDNPITIDLQANFTGYSGTGSLTPDGLSMFYSGFQDGVLEGGSVFMMPYLDLGPSYFPSRNVQIYDEFTGSHTLIIDWSAYNTWEAHNPSAYRDGQNWGNVFGLGFAWSGEVVFGALGAAGSTYAGPLPSGSSGSNYVNLASKSRTVHIIAGDATGGGHAWFGSTKSFMNGLSGKKSMFPITWSNGKIMNAVSEVVTSNPWVQQSGRAGAKFTRSGKPVRFATTGYYNGTLIKVINTHSEIITAFPIR